MTATASMTADLTARNQRVLDHYPMVRAIAYRIHRRLPRSVDVDDLISAGTAGLLEAVERYESSQSVPFESYARFRVQGAIVDALRAQDWVPRSVRRKADELDRTQVNLREKLGRSPNREEMSLALSITPERYDHMVTDSEVRPMLSLDAPMSNGNDSLLIDQIGRADDFIEALHEDQIRDLVVDAVRDLPEREKTAVALYYFHELSLKEVGAVLGVSESRACQLCGQGIKRLRKKLREHL